jgi:superfamily II DNA or RNA helicase
MRLHLDRQQIERLASNSEVYRRGFALYKEGRTGELFLGENESYVNIQANIDGTYGEYNVSASFDKTGMLKKYVCNCDAFGVWRGACKHVVGMLLKLLEQGQKQALTSRRMKESAALIDLFEQLAFSEIEENMANRIPSANPVSVEPTFSSDAAAECFLTFKIGRRRKYVVKDIAEFTDGLRNERTVRYGKDFEFNHSISAFDGDSAELVKLICDERDLYDKLNKQNNRYSYYNSYGSASRRLVLSPRGLDKFFDIYAGRGVQSAFDSSPNTKLMTLSDGAPPAIFRVARREGGVMLSQVEGKVLLFAGEAWRYIFFENVLYRTDKGAFSVLSPIFAAFKRMGEHRVTFSEKEVSRFSAFVLPKLVRNGLANITKEFSESIGDEEYTKKAYLDSRDGIVTCRAVICRDLLEEDILYAPKQATPQFGIEAYKFKALLLRMGFIEENGVFLLGDDDGIYDFYYSPGGLEELRKNAEVFITDAFKGITVRPKRQASFGLRINGSLLEISVNTEGYSKDELMDVLESYRAKKRFHRLRDGSFVDFANRAESVKQDESGSIIEYNNRDANLEAMGDLFEGLALTEKDFRDGVAKVPKYRALYAAEVAERDGLHVDIDDGFKKLVDDFGSYKDLDFAVPDTLNGVLRSYQKEGYKWLMTLVHYGFGGILADDMGLGKTLQAITVMLTQKIEDGKKNEKSDKSKSLPSIVVAPTSLIYNWEKEIRRFAPELRSLVVAGAAAKRKELFEGESDFDVLITTYDMLKRDIENYTDTEFRYIIADEAQNIKNPSTQNAKAVKMLKGAARFALTGTPVENALSELWSIFDFVMPGYLFNSAKFSKVFESPILKNDDKDAAERLKRHIAPFILRRLKREVLTELPPKIETTLYAEMAPEQKKIYAAYLLKAKGELNEIIRGGSFNQSRIDILSKLTRLRQICCHPATFAEDYTGGSGKLDLTMTSLEDFLAGGHRVLIFSQFTSMLAIIREKLDEQGVEYFYLDGATDSRTRMDMTEAFNDGDCSVFLISLKAGGSGLNLTGADVVIHYDPWWNPAVMDQASDRAHRIGQRKTVQVFNIVAKDTIEEKIIALQEMKKNLVDSVITEGAQFINRMEMDDIVDLFK